MIFNTMFDRAGTQMISKYMSRNTIRGRFRKKKKQPNQQLPSSCGVNGQALMRASENHADLHDVSIWLFSKGKDLLPKGKKQPMELFRMGR